MEPSGSRAPEAQPLVETKKRGGSRALLVILVAIIVVLAGALAYTTLKLLTPPPTAPGGTFSVQSAQPTGVQGQPLRFVVSNLKQGAKARVHFGDGQILETSDSTFNYSYSVPGNYLVWVQQFFPSNGTVVSDLAASLFKVTIVPDIPFELSQFVSVPTIYFNTTRNPTAPIVAPNAPVYVYGNYTEISQLFSKMTSYHNKTPNITVNETLAVAVDHYVWDFGNGQTMTVTADPSTSYPVTNPIPVSYPASGSYAATLTLVTAETLTSEIHNLTSNITFTNTDTINTFSITVGTTVAVGAFAIVKLRNVVPSPGVITELVNSPGGPFSFDPQIDYETTGFEVVVNTQATLIFYNANSTTDWFPYLASEIPTVANGGISGNFTIYKFHLRPDVAFSNGDPITGYDVWYSTIRAMLFSGGHHVDSGRLPRIPGSGKRGELKPAKPVPAGGGGAVPDQHVPPQHGRGLDAQSPLPRDPEHPEAEQHDRRGMGVVSRRRLSVVRQWPRGHCHPPAAALLQSVAAARDGRSDPDLRTIPVDHGVLRRVQREHYDIADGVRYRPAIHHPTGLLREPPCPPSVRLCVQLHKLRGQYPRQQEVRVQLRE